MFWMCMHPCVRTNEAKIVRITDVQIYNTKELLYLKIDQHD